MNQQSIYCTQCSNWVRRKCNGTSKAEFDILAKKADGIPFHCILCSIQNNAEVIPFGYSSSSALLDLFGTDLPSQLALLPTFETRSKLSNLPNLNDFDMDDNLIHTIDSKYYEIPEFSKLNYAVKDGFSLFHLNIRSLSAHLTELSQLLSCFNYMFDVLGICETKEQIDSGFLANVSLPGYNMHSTPSKSSAGGVALYI